MKAGYWIIILLLLPFTLAKGEEKNINRKFKVNPGQRVYINGVSSLDLKVIGWDKNEAEVNLNIKVKSSDSGFEKEFLQSFDVTYRYDGNDIYIDFKETNKKGSWSLLDIFKGDFKYSFYKELKGIIYLPSSSVISGDFKISVISITGIDEQVTIKSNGSQITLNDCRKVGRISSEYDEIVINNSGGKPEAEINSTNIRFDNFTGLIKCAGINGSFKINNLSGSLSLNATNIWGTIEDVTDNVYTESKLSDFTFSNVNGFLDLRGKSNNYKVYDVKGFKLEGSNIKLTADKISAGEKEKIFITTNEGKYKITNSSGLFFIDDDHSDFEFSGITGNINYSASNSSFTGRNIKGDWNSDTKHSYIDLIEISAGKIEASGIGKTFKAIITNTPKKVDIKNEDSNVELYINPDIKTSLFLTARHGNLSSNFSINKYKEGATYKAAERLNGGGAVLSVETRNGDISVKKRASNSD